MPARSLSPELLAFGQKLNSAVMNAGRQNGWRVQQFGTNGFNCDVIVGLTILKLTLGGDPAPDGTGASVRLSRAGFDRSLSVRRSAAGDLDLTDEAGVPVDEARWLDLVGEGCGAPVRVTRDYPTPLQRLSEQVALEVVTIGQEHGWRVQPFGTQGLNVDVIVGSIVVKVTTEPGASPDGAGALFRVRSTAGDATFATRLVRGGALEIGDEHGRVTGARPLLEAVGLACGTPLTTEEALPPRWVRLCERLAARVVMSGQTSGWKVRRFGKRGFHADVESAEHLAKITSEPPPGGGDEGTITVQRPGYSRRYTTRLGPEAELELVRDGSPVPTSDLIEALAEACNTPLKGDPTLPGPLARLCDELTNLVTNLGLEQGFAVRPFRAHGINLDVELGQKLVKVTTGQPAPDGTGATIQIARTGFGERALTTRLDWRGALELSDGTNPISARRFVELIAEAGQMTLRSAEEIPPALRRLCERVASAVASAGDVNGWRVRRFGSGPYSADVAVGADLVKVTTEGRPAADGSGTTLKVKRGGREQQFGSRMGKASELELTDDAGAPVTLERFVDVLKEVCR